MRLLFLFSFLVGIGFTQTQRVKTFAQQLCSPEFHGRGYVNGGDSIAAEYIAKTFQELGLRPIGKSYFQSFEFKAHTFPGKMQFSSDKRTFQPGVHYITDPGSNSINGTYTIKEVDGKTLLSKSVSIEKSEILVCRNVGFSSDSTRKIREKLHTLAQRYPIVEVVNTKLTWSVDQEHYLKAYLQLQDSVYTSTSSFSFAIDAKTKMHTARNVIGFLPAKKKKAPYLVLTAHYDHLGRMGTATYFPGANDNASGVAMLVALAEKFASNNLKDFNVVFIAFAGEEIGLLGSQFFVQHATFPLQKVKFLFNLDIMGSGEEGITVVNATLFPDEFKRLVAINDEKKYLAQVKSRGPAANSDHYFFTQAGVPGFYAYTMGPNKNYHDIFDTYDALSFKAFDALSCLLEDFLRGF